MPDIDEVNKKKKRSLLEVLLTSGFSAAFSTALVLYINSSFLETIIPKDWVGVLYSVAFGLTFLFIQRYSALIGRFGNYAVSLTVIALEALALFIMSLNPHPAVTLTAFVVFVILYTSLVINFDLFLEGVSNFADTGRIRGMFWTAANLGLMLGPFFSGLITDRLGFSGAYSLAAVSLLPAWVLLFFTYRHSGKPKQARPHSLRDTLKRIHANRDLRGIYLIAFVLYFFYSWMVIYTPIYLVESGFSWEQIGGIFTVMLVPFVLIQYPAGWLADRYFGETEMLTIGLAIMGLSVIGLLYVSGYWAAMLVLFCSRVGAALVEIMRDVYFYKKVEEDDLDLIDLFRNMGSLANVVAPLLASAILAVGFGIPAIFVALVLVLFAATVIPFTIKDTL